MNGILEELARFKQGKSRRISSYDRSGGNADYIKIVAGETVDIANISGMGIIRHIWVTFGSKDPMQNRNTILRMYWDEETKPSVESPIGDFFGQGWGEEYPYASLPLCVAPVRAFNSFFPMPFSRKARIEIENDSEQDIHAFYYIIDYQEREAEVEDMGRFHVQWRRRLNVSPELYENEWQLFHSPAANLTDAFNHVFIEAEGKGHYVGLNYYVDSPTPLWYGEGDDMFFIDGESWPPSIHGTGTEDYFNSSHCPKTVFSYPYFGYPRVNNNIGFLGRTHCYRFHIEDPIIFNKSLRGSIECGHADAITMDLITTAYWYQNEPHKPFTALLNRAGRMNMPVITPRDIHKWREAWKHVHKDASLWGNENLPKAFLKELERKRTAGRKKLTPTANIKIAQQEKKKYERILNHRKHST